MLRALALILALASAPVYAASPLVEEASVTRQGMLWRVTVTLRHPDEGWDHFADAWRVEDRFGNIIATRDLLHPHVDEQPFTRSSSGVEMPDGTRVIYIRAHCSEDGWDHHAFAVEVRPGR